MDDTFYFSLIKTPPRLIINQGDGSVIDSFWDIINHSPLFYFICHYGGRDSLQNHSGRNNRRGRRLCLLVFRF